MVNKSEDAETTETLIQIENPEIVDNYVVRIDEFEGPLDVLLHLIQKSKVDIMDISIAEITNQYIKYLQSMKDLNLEIAADYLLMSARLIEMKSRWLLPQMKDEDEVEADPRAELIARLLDYKKYKDVAETFKGLEGERQQVYSKELSDISEWVQDETLLNLDKKRDVYQLVMAFEKMLQRQRLNRTREVTMKREEISIEEQLDFLEKTMIRDKKVNITKMMENHDRTYIVVTFLAVLQLVRVQQISVEQDENFSDIHLLSTDSE